MLPARPKTITPQHKMLIYMMAIGRTNAQVSQELEMNGQYVGMLRHQFKDEIDAVVQEVKEAIVERRVSLTKRFDDEADNSFARLTDLRDGTENLSVALKATLEMLDRSTMAPIMSRQNKEGETKVLQIPTVQIMNILTAASEDGMEEEVQKVIDGLQD